MLRDTNKARDVPRCQKNITTQTTRPTASSVKTEPRANLWRSGWGGPQCGNKLSARYTKNVVCRRVLESHMPVTTFANDQGKAGGTTCTNQNTSDLNSSKIFNSEVQVRDSNISPKTKHKTNLLWSRMTKGENIFGLGAWQLRCLGAHDLPQYVQMRQSVSPGLHTHMRML